MCTYLFQSLGAIRLLDSNLIFETFVNGAPSKFSTRISFFVFTPF